MFCPKCGNLIVPSNDKKGMKCRCGFKTAKKKSIIITEKIKKERGIEVIDKEVKTLPKVKQDCPKCKHEKAYFWTLQTRASDEPETRFFECVKCGHRWREY